MESAEVPLWAKVASEAAVSDSRGLAAALQDVEAVLEVLRAHLSRPLRCVERLL